jgi:hypothetical protein
MQELHLAEKKNTKKKQDSDMLNPQPIQSFSTPRYTEKTGGLLSFHGFVFIFHVQNFVVVAWWSYIVLVSACYGRLLLLHLF